MMNFAHLEKVDPLTLTLTLSRREREPQNHRPLRNGAVREAVTVSMIQLGMNDGKQSARDPSSVSLFRLELFLNLFESASVFDIEYSDMAKDVLQGFMLGIVLSLSQPLLHLLAQYVENIDSALRFVKLPLKC